MSVKDRLMEWLLAAWDRIMDGITRGEWERGRGRVVPNVKVQKEM